MSIWSGDPLRRVMRAAAARERGQAAARDQARAASARAYGVPGNLAVGGELVEPGRPPAPCEQAQRRGERGAPAAVEQLVVVEVHVDDRRELLWSERASAPSECVVGSSSSRRPSASRTQRGLVELRARRAGRPGRTGARRSRCSPRSRGRRPPPSPRSPCTSRRRRRTAARGPARAARRPRGARAPPGQARSAARASARSSGCDGRRARAPPPGGRARRTAPRFSPSAGGRISDAIRKPPGFASSSAR